MIRAISRWSALLLAVLLLSACTGPRIADYATTTPALDLFGYFAGTTRGYGMVQERDGTLIRRFTVDITGTVTGNILTLDERFVYDDGEKQQRIWTIERLADGRYRGTAGDVVGAAAGEIAGAALQWRYTLRLPARGREWELAFNDWMFLHDGRVLMNRAEFSKWGIRLGEVTLFFVKDPAQPL